MNFQTSLPYAADSGLHVIAGLNVGGTPIYQRHGLDRILPVDMYTLLQGIIERCLATWDEIQQRYLVLPNIYSSTWTERTYPGGVLNEVSGYVTNLMDNYPAGALLAAIDDKLWALGSCGVDPIHEGASCYGTLMDTVPYWNEFLDITFAMTAAGVAFDPVSFEMQCIPARVTGGAPIYGPPATSGRIYPELLIDRYKVMQQLRWKKAVMYDTRPAGGSGGEQYAAYANPNPPGFFSYYWVAPTRDDWIKSLD